MKKIICILLSTILIAFSFPIATGAVSVEDSFLNGDWETSDGVMLSFYDDGTYDLQWGYFPAESGRWDIGDSTSGSSFVIEMDGSTILSLMSSFYGTSSANYHFEVLRCNNDNFYLVQVYDIYTAYTSNCKLGFTREGAEPDFTIPEETDQEYYEENSVDTSVKTLSIPFNWHDKTVTIDINWGWDLFDKSATEYDHNLAMSGLALSQLIHDPDTFQDKLENTFGLEDIYFSKEASSLVPSYAIGHKRVNLSGKTRDIVVMSLRGTRLDRDNANDAIIDISSVGDGFRPAANSLDSALKEYLVNNINHYNKQNTVLFITGHSLGGAVAQCLAPYAEKYADADKCFIYTFAAANAYIADSSKTYDNVHNIINIPDIVPDVPLGFGKNGHCWFYDSNDKKYKPYFEETYQEKNWHSKGFLDDHDITTYFAMMICEVPTNMGSGAENPYSHSSIHCPVDIAVYDDDGVLMGKTSGDSVEWAENSKVLIIAKDGEKEVVAPYGVHYKIIITGTGDGTMTVNQKTVNPDNNETLDEKEFKDVAVSTTSAYSLYIDGGSLDKTELTPIDKDNATAEGEKAERSDNKVLLLLIIAAIIVFIVLLVLVLLLKQSKKQKEEAERARHSAGRRTYTGGRSYDGARRNNSADARRGNSGRRNSNDRRRNDDSRRRRR